MIKYYKKCWWVINKTGMIYGICISHQKWNMWKRIIKNKNKLRWCVVNNRSHVLGQVSVVCTNQINRKWCHRRLIMLCFSTISLDEKVASVWLSGPFITWSSRKTMNWERRLPEYSCLRPLVPSWSKFSILVKTSHTTAENYLIWWVMVKVYSYVWGYGWG